MLEKIRIYYESLEQGANYIKPIVEKSLENIGSNIDIELVKLKESWFYYSKNIAPIVFWKNPDILITVIMDEVEYPLLLIEFSNAVFTEDHELQRFDGLVAAAENNCIYVKISPISKHSQSDHGGNIHFDYLIPFSLILKKFGKLFYHFDWKCDDKGIVEVDKEYLSCPNELADFDNLIAHLTKLLLKGNFKSGNWINDLEKDMRSESYFQRWKEKVEGCSLPNITSLYSTRTEWNSSTEKLILKFNRFGHAMDPERGMLAFYGNLTNEITSKMLFSAESKAWYKDIPKEKEIENHIKESGLKKGYDYLYCFMLGSGLSSYSDFKQIVLGHKNNADATIEIDLTSFLKKNYLSLSKPMRTIFKYSTDFCIVDDNNETKVRLFWNGFDRREIYTDLPSVTNIKEKKCFDEDDVTYIMVHNVLKQNDYVVLAVSYPGAQSDRVVLIAPGTGRAQERKYIDIISYLPEKYTNLQENKGIFSPGKIQEDIDKLAKYKTESEYKAAIFEFIDRFDRTAPKIINIGVGFWANSKFTVSKVTELNIRDLDYFVYLTSDRKEWFIWSTGKCDMFNKNNGKIEIPQAFEIIRDT